jgi:trigger factor
MREVAAVESNVTEVNDVAREIVISAGVDELKPHFDKKYKEYRPKVDIKGFRKGKAPLDLVIKLYGEMIEQDSLQEVATEFYKLAITENDLKPIGEPTLVDMDYKRGEKLTFKIRYDIRPKITLKKYKGLKVQKPVHTLSDADVDEELLRLRRMNATLSEVDSVTDQEHVVTADLQDLDEQGMPIIGKRTPDSRFYLADEKLEKPFKETLKNAEKGGEYTVRFEHDHGDHKHPVNSRISVKKIEQVVLPDFDDAFVTKITNEKTTSTTAFMGTAEGA